MAATASLVNHGPFQPVWTEARKLRESQKTPARNSARRRSSIANAPMEYIDPGRAELRSVLVRTHAVMDRTTSGQNYEKAVKAVNAEYWPPPKAVPGEWFPGVSEVFDLRMGSVDAGKVNHLCDILEQMPFLFKAIDRIKINWLRNNYPLPLRIVRALDRDDFELISSNFPRPIGDINRYPGAMWTMSTDSSSKRSQPRQFSRRDTTRFSRPFDRAALLAADQNFVSKSVVPHRRDWNRLVHRYLDDCVAALRPGGQQQQQGRGNRLSFAGGERKSVSGDRRHFSLEAEQAATSAAAAAATAATAAAAAAAAAAATAAATATATAAATAPTADSVAWQTGRPDRPFSRLMEPLYPPWQLVEEAEEGARRISNISSVSAEDAKLIMKRCMLLKSSALNQMDLQYKAKIHKLEDNREQRYRRKVAYLVPPYRTAGADMPAIRRRVQRRSRLEDVNLRSAAWYSRLLQLCATLGATDVQRCRQLLERLLPFSRLEGSQTARGSEKLCLLLMSVPIYDALQASLQMAVLFVHVHFLGGSEKVFRRWLEARSLTDSTKSSPLLGLFRGEVTLEDDSSDSDGESCS